MNNSNKVGRLETTIRDFSADSDYERCEEMQRQTWGDDFAEFVPCGILKIVQKIGGVAAGAYDSTGEMRGFVLGFSGMRHGEPAHWSHMLAVDPELRNAGLGTRLKQFQRDRLLSMGIRTMYWTFDPLVARNAHLNLNHLGTTIDEYVESMYGEGDRGVLDSVIGTDRFITRWALDSPVDRDPVADTSSETCNSGFDGSSPVPVEFEAPRAATAFIEIPSDIQALKDRNPDMALEWRLNTREAFSTLLGAGYVITGFGRTDAGRCFYRLERGQ